jgi:hypothetical protein
MGTHPQENDPLSTDRLCNPGYHFSHVFSCQELGQGVEKVGQRTTLLPGAGKGGLLNLMSFFFTEVNVTWERSRGFILFIHSILFTGSP